MFHESLVSENYTLHLNLKQMPAELFDSVDQAIRMTMWMKFLVWFISGRLFFADVDIMLTLRTVLLCVLYFMFLHVL